MLGIVEQRRHVKKLKNEEWHLFGNKASGSRTYRKTFPGRVRLVVVHCIVNTNRYDVNQRKGFPVDIWMFGEGLPHNSGNHSHYYDFSENKITVENDNEVAIEFPSLGNYTNSWVNEARYRKVCAYVYYE